MTELNCYAENYNGLVRLYIREENHEEHGDVSIWENDELRDDLYSYGDLIGEYGEFYYDTKQDFKDDNKQKFSEYFNFEI